jgi:23S rRNA (cytosine1962-C5)-methyltransferase
MTNTHLDHRIVLRKKEDHRITAGHPWVFSNEIATVHGSPGPGDVVEVQNAGGRTLGIGLYHPHSLIAARLLSTHIEKIDLEFFRKRIAQALSLRLRTYHDSAVYRLVHGESDFLPGLIIDRFNDTCVIQTFSYGMDMRQDDICNALEDLLHPRCIVERNESPLRALESLSERRGVLRGEPGPVEIQEHGLRYFLHPLEGQKTGFFLDQCENRLLAQRYSRGARVLDCFCNDGGFALNAARGGAASVLAIDASEEETKRGARNTDLNGISTVTFETADVFERLRSLREEGSRFDLIILDPPSFTRTRKNVPAAKRGYRELHEGALRLLPPDGLLMTASCSHHIEPETFMQVIQDAAFRCGRLLQIIDWRGAAPDHPTLPAVPETRYLKMGVFRALEAFTTEKGVQ